MTVLLSLQPRESQLSAKSRDLLKESGGGGEPHALQVEFNQCCTLYACHKIRGGAAHLPRYSRLMPGIHRLVQLCPPVFGYSCALRLHTVTGAAKKYYTKAFCSFVANLVGLKS